MTSTTLSSKVVSFHLKYGCPLDEPLKTNIRYDNMIQVMSDALRADAETYRSRSEDIRLLRMSLMVEELAELLEALAWGDRESVAKEGADLIYTVIGTLETFSIDTETAFDEVHRANMTNAEGYAVNNRDKGKDYSAPDMKGSLR